MSRWTDHASQANAELLDEFYSTLDHWIHQKEQDDRRALDQDEQAIEGFTHDQ